MSRPKIIAQLSGDGITAVLQVPLRPDGASTHDLDDVVAACADLWWRGTTALEDEDEVEADVSGDADAAD